MSDRNEGRRHLEDAAPEPEPVDEPEGLEVVAWLSPQGYVARVHPLEGSPDQALVKKSDATTLLAEKDAEIERLRGDNDRLRADRCALLEVQSVDGLLSSEWLMRTATAEKALKEARARITELEAQEREGRDPPVPGEEVRDGHVYGDRPMTADRTATSSSSADLTAIRDRGEERVVTEAQPVAESDSREAAGPPGEGEARGPHSAQLS